MLRLIVLVSCTPLLLVAAGCCPTTAGPTGPTATFSGTAAGVLVFHDFPNPSGTTQMDVVLTWSDRDVQLRLFWVDATCNPIEQQDCRRFSDPIGSPPNSTGTISVIAANQGPAEGPRMRFVVQNITTDRPASYSLTVAPRRAGCT
jgi:hypothetical protein